MTTVGIVAQGAEEVNDDTAAPNLSRWPSALRAVNREVNAYLRWSGNNGRRLAGKGSHVL